MKYTHNEMIKKFPVIFEFLTHSYEKNSNSLDEAKKLINEDWLKSKENTASIYSEYFKV